MQIGDRSGLAAGQGLARSAMRSSASSIPTESRTVPGPMPDQTPLLGRQVARLLHCRRDHQRFSRAEARRDREELERLGEPAARLEPARDVEAHDAAEILHLTRRPIMAWIVREAPGTTRVPPPGAPEELGDALRAAALRVATHEKAPAGRAA